MAFKLPWSNFHELNLDWLLEKVKALEETVAGITGSADPSDTPPVMDGTASAGSSANYSRGDHVHPTDTSRASQEDLTALSGQLNYEVRELAASIDSVDAKIGFSSAAPLMDSSSASSGSSPYQARADHVHPTDTSRASAVEVATLSARMDAFAGSANPSDTMPTMAGAGTAGSGANYSRGDHQHPSDTSKLDVAGGTVAGPLTVRDAFNNLHMQTNATSDAIGWMRVATVPQVAGTSALIEIAKRGVSTPAEIHAIRLDITSTAYSFNHESSKGNIKIIDKIRYTNAGAIDIHFDQNYPVLYEVHLAAFAPTSAEKNAVHVLEVPVSVQDVPQGENILAEYSFVQNDYLLTTMSSEHTINYQKCVTYSIGDAKLTMVDAVVTLTSDVSTGAKILAGLPVMLFRGWAVPIASTHSGTQITGDATGTWINVPALANGTQIRIHALYISI